MISLCLRLRFTSKEAIDVGERELKTYINKLNKYVATAKKTETKEQSRASLVRIGVLDKRGRVRKRYQGVIK